MDIDPLAREALKLNIFVFCDGEANLSMKPSMGIKVAPRHPVTRQLAPLPLQLPILIN